MAKAAFFIDTFAEVAQFKDSGPRLLSCALQ
jgi:hypothetical protein